MDNNLCSACKNKLINQGSIPDGILLKCTNCGSKKIFIENYNFLKDDLSFGSAYREKIDHSKVLHLIKLFEKKYKKASVQPELLDIGFGNGEFMLAMNKKGFIVSGLECDANAVSLIKKKGINANYGELGSEMKLERKFDIITIWDVLEHVLDVEKALIRLEEITKKNGKIFIVTPNADSLLDSFANIERQLSFYRSQRIMNICLNRYHLHRFSIKGLKILLERFGFLTEDVELVRLFSLKEGVYTDGFAPGISKWTNNSSFNKLLSKSAMAMIRTFNIKNKIFLSAVKK